MLMLDLSYTSVQALPVELRWLCVEAAAQSNVCNSS